MFLPSSRARLAAWWLLAAGGCRMDNPSFSASDVETEEHEPDSSVPNNDDDDGNGDDDDDDDDDDSPGDDDDTAGDDDDATGDDDDDATGDDDDATGDDDDATGDDDDATGDDDDATGDDDDATGDDDDADSDPCAVQSNNLVLCLEFETTESSGNLHFADRSPAGNHAYLSGIVDYGTGVRGRAVSMSNGIQLAVRETPTLDLTTFTIDVWIRPSTLTGLHWIIDNDEQYGLSVDPSQTFSTNVLNTASGPPPVIGSWTRLTMVVTQSHITLYMDGDEQESSPTGPTNAGSNTGMTIGSNNPSNDASFYGLIDSLRIWNVALDPADI